MLPLRDENPTSRTAWVTIVLILLNVGVYFLVQPSATDVQSSAKFTFERAAIPCEVTSGEPLTADEYVNGTCTDDSAFPELFPGKRVWVAILVSMFLHGSLWHLGGNMLFLWVFGNNVEDRMGWLQYLGFYLLAGVVATIAHIAVQPSSTIPLIGASGAVAGVMGAYLVWHPRAPVLALVFFIVTHVPAWLLLSIWFVQQFFVNPNEGVAWVAHVGGFVFGAVAALAYGRRRREPELTW